MLHRCSIAFGRRHLGHRTSKSLSLRDSRGALPTLSRTVLISPRYCDDSHGWPRWPGCNLLTTTFVLLTMRKLAVVTEVAAAKAEISTWSLLQYEIQVSCFEQETVSQTTTSRKRAQHANKHHLTLDSAGMKSSNGKNMSTLFYNPFQHVRYLDTVRYCST